MSRWPRVSAARCVAVVRVVRSFTSRRSGGAVSMGVQEGVQGLGVACGGGAAVAAVGSGLCPDGAGAGGGAGDEPGFHGVGPALSAQGQQGRLWGYRRNYGGRGPSGGIPQGPAGAGRSGGWGVPVTGRRRVAGLGREELARLAGISEPYLVRFERGADRRPSRQVLRSLARVLDLDADVRHTCTSLRVSGAVLDPGRGCRERSCIPVAG
ncbi:helix-turn-helix domain-containing protein [Streptomyces sp. NPDC058221]|uniref:helix-turn-helix domain-containing protein n=1 Tax=Streptomyces sp. NPDC058221 TaxID=3346388 RepID=UPI0036E942AE